MSASRYVYRGSPRLYEVVKTFMELFYPHGSSSVARTVVDSQGVHYVYGSSPGTRKIGSSTTSCPSAKSSDKVVAARVKNKDTGKISCEKRRVRRVVDVPIGEALGEEQNQVMPRSAVDAKAPRSQDGTLQKKKSGGGNSAPSCLPR